MSYYKILYTAIEESYPRLHSLAINIYSKAQIWNSLGEEHTFYNLLQPEKVHWKYTETGYNTDHSVLNSHQFSNQGEEI